MKKNTKIKLIALNLFLLSNAALAASGNKDMKVSATVEKGCVVSASPYNFGDIKSSILFEISGTLTMQCSKGMQVVITGSDLNNPGAINGPRMWHENAKSDLRNSRIRYSVLTKNVQDNSDLQVIKHPRANSIWNYRDATFDYRFIVKFLTGNMSVLPMVAAINSDIGINLSDTVVPFNNMLLLPGNYSDTFTYTLTF